MPVDVVLAELDCISNFNEMCAASGCAVEAIGNARDAFVKSLQANINAKSTVSMQAAALLSENQWHFRKGQRRCMAASYPLQLFGVAIATCSVELNYSAAR